MVDKVTGLVWFDPALGKNNGKTQVLNELVKNRCNIPLETTGNGTVPLDYQPEGYMKDYHTTSSLTPVFYPPLKAFGDEADVVYLKVGRTNASGVGISSMKPYNQEYDTFSSIGGLESSTLDPADFTVKCSIKRDAIEELITIPDGFSPGIDLDYYIQESSGMFAIDDATEPDNAQLVIDGDLTDPDGFFFNSTALDYAKWVKRVITWNPWAGDALSLLNEDEFFWYAVRLHKYEGVDGVRKISVTSSWSETPKEFEFQTNGTLEFEEIASPRNASGDHRASGIYYYDVATEATPWHTSAKEQGEAWISNASTLTTWSKTIDGPWERLEPPHNDDIRGVLVEGQSIRIVPVVGNFDVPLVGVGGVWLTDAAIFGEETTKVAQQVKHWGELSVLYTGNTDRDLLPVGGDLNNTLQIGVIQGDLPNLYGKFLHVLDEVGGSTVYETNTTFFQGENTVTAYNYEFLLTPDDSGDLGGVSILGYDTDGGVVPDSSATPEPLELEGFQVSTIQSLVVGASSSGQLSVNVVGGAALLDDFITNVTIDGVSTGLADSVSIPANPLDKVWKFNNFPNSALPDGVQVSASIEGVVIVPSGSSTVGQYTRYGRYTRYIG